MFNTNNNKNVPRNGTGSRDGQRTATAGEEENGYTRCRTRYNSLPLDTNNAASSRHGRLCFFPPLRKWKAKANTHTLWIA